MCQQKSSCTDNDNDDDNSNVDGANGDVDDEWDSYKKYIAGAFFFVVCVGGQGMETCGNDVSREAKQVRKWNNFQVNVS